jgi:hypothetical protein
VSVKDRVRLGCERRSLDKRPAALERSDLGNRAGAGDAGRHDLRHDSADILRPAGRRGGRRLRDNRDRTANASGSKNTRPRTRMTPQASCLDGEGAARGSSKSTTPAGTIFL